MRPPFSRFARGSKKARVPGEMNKTEARYADHLKALAIAGLVEWWDYEPVTLKLGKDLRYTPDFLVILAGSLEMEFHEVKAGIRQKKRDGSKEYTGKIKPYFSDEGAKPKIVMAAEKFPIRFAVVWENAGGWERKDF